MLTIGSGSQEVDKKAKPAGLCLLKELGRWNGRRAVAKCNPRWHRPSRGRVGVLVEDAFRNWICGSTAKLWIGYWRRGIASSWVSWLGHLRRPREPLLIPVLRRESSGCSLRLSCKRRAGTTRDLTSRLQIDRKPNSELPSWAARMRDGQPGRGGESVWDHSHPPTLSWSCLPVGGVAGRDPRPGIAGLAFGRLWGPGWHTRQICRWRRDQCAEEKRGPPRARLDSPGLPRRALEAVVLSLGPFLVSKRTRRGPPEYCVVCYRS